MCLWVFLIAIEFCLVGIQWASQCDFLMSYISLAQPIWWWDLLCLSGRTLIFEGQILEFLIYLIWDILQSILIFIRFSEGSNTDTQETTLRTTEAYGQSCTMRDPECLKRYVWDHWCLIFIAVSHSPYLLALNCLMPQSAWPGYLVTGMAGEVGTTDI